MFYKGTLSASIVISDLLDHLKVINQTNYDSSRLWFINLTKGSSVFAFAFSDRTVQQQDTRKHKLYAELQIKLIFCVFFKQQEASHHKT